MVSYDFPIATGVCECNLKFEFLNCTETVLNIEGKFLSIGRAKKRFIEKKLF